MVRRAAEEGRSDRALDLALDVDVDLDGPEPPATAGPAPVVSPAQRRRRRRRRLVLLAAAAAALVVVVAVQRAPRGGQDAPPLDGTASAEVLFPVLAEQQVPGTALPDRRLAATAGIAEGSERLLAVAPAASFWVARDSSGGVCLVVVSSQDELARGAVCTSTRAAVGGVVFPPGSGPSAVLLPEGADTAGVAEAGYSQLAPGLWVDADTAQDAAEALVQSASRQEVVVPARAQRGSGRLPVMLTDDGARYAVVLSCLTAVEVRLSVGAEESPSQPCPAGGVVREFTGDGGVVQVGVEAPDDAVWAAEVDAARA